MKANGSDRASRKGCIQCSREFTSELTLCPHDGTRLTTLMDSDLVGTVLADRYEILEVIGGGGMGLVYKARQRLMNRIVAIKMLHRHMISSAEALKRFQLEAQAASRLSLPNILTIYDFELTPDGQPYMVMDYLEGASLADLLEDYDQLPVMRSLNIFAQVCAGLWHAHQKGIIHRDLKPSNIMLINFGDQSDFVKIVDFGIAKLLRSNDQAAEEQLTRTGEVFGSPLYMSPEQCKGKPLDQRSDIYSLGSVMYRTLTGHPLFSGEEVVEFLFKQVSEPPLPFKEIAPDLNIPARVEEVVFKALEKEPEKRFQSMSELKDAIEFLKNQLAKEGYEDVMTAPRQTNDATPSSVPPGEEISGARPPQVQKMALPEYEPIANERGQAQTAQLAVNPRTGLAAELGVTGAAKAIVSEDQKNDEQKRDEQKKPQPGFPVAPLPEPRYQQNAPALGTSTNSSLPALKPLGKAATPRPGNIPILKAGYQNVVDSLKAASPRPESPVQNELPPSFSDPVQANVPPPSGFSHPQETIESTPSPNFSEQPPSDQSTAASSLSPPPATANPAAQPVPGLPPSMADVHLDRIPQNAMAPQPHIQPLAPLDRIFAAAPHQAPASPTSLPAYVNPENLAPHTSLPNFAPNQNEHVATTAGAAPQAPPTPFFAQGNGMETIINPLLDSSHPISPNALGRDPLAAPVQQQQRIARQNDAIARDNPIIPKGKSEPVEIPRRAGFANDQDYGAKAHNQSRLPDQAPAQPSMRVRKITNAGPGFNLSERYSNLSDHSPGLLQNKRLYLGLGFGVVIIFGLTFAIQEFGQREESKTVKTVRPNLTAPLPNEKASAPQTAKLVPRAKLPSASQVKERPVAASSINVQPPKASVVSRTVENQDVSKPKVLNTPTSVDSAHPVLIARKHHHASHSASSVVPQSTASQPEPEKTVVRHAYSTYGY